VNDETRPAETEAYYRRVEDALLESLEAEDPRRGLHWQTEPGALHWWVEGPLDTLALMLAGQGWSPPKKPSP
jgi:DNA-binding transcriptional MocR family regulator